jgi:hypothetical protein
VKRKAFLALYVASAVALGIALFMAVCMVINRTRPPASRKFGRAIETAAQTQVR